MLLYCGRLRIIQDNYYCTLNIIYEHFTFFVQLSTLILLFFSEYFPEKGIFPEFPALTATGGTYKQLHVEV